MHILSFPKEKSKRLVSQIWNVLAYSFPPFLFTPLFLCVFLPCFGLIQVLIVHAGLYYFFAVYSFKAFMLLFETVCVYSISRVAFLHFCPFDVSIQ